MAVETVMRRWNWRVRWGVKNVCGLLCLLVYIYLLFVRPGGLHAYGCWLL